MSINSKYITIFNSLTPTIKDLLIEPCDYYEIPIEMWQNVLEYMSPSDLYNLMITNKTFFKIVLTHSKSLSYKFSKTLFRTIERNLFWLNRIKYNNILIEKFNFITIMNIYNFAVSNSFHNQYNDFVIILKEQKHPIVYYDITSYKLMSVSLYQASIRYGILKMFYKGDFKLDASSMIFIKFINSFIFQIIFAIIWEFPSILSIFTLDNYQIFNNYFSYPQNISNKNYNNIINYINNICNIGGLPEKAFYYLVHNKFKEYGNLLICGVKEEDISKIIFTSFENEKLLIFKALVPIVGYYYAKDFILDKRCNIDDYPYFLQVASKMNEHNVYTNKYLKFSKTGNNIDKILTLRNRKRKIEE
jgi:hypothetical protein